MPPTNWVRDPYLRNGLVAMLALAAVYATLDDPSSFVTVQFAALLVAAAIYALGSPTRWSVRTTLWLYRAVPLLVGLGGTVAGGYGLLSTDVPVLASVLVGWGLGALLAFVVAPWEEVETHLERVQAPDTELDGAPSPLPERHMLWLRHVAGGLLVVTTVVVVARLLVQPDFGQLAVLAGVAGAGLVHTVCSPYGGSPGRVVRRRRARWAVLAAGTAAGSLYGTLVSGAVLSGVLFGALAVGLAYWTTVGGSWAQVREDIAATQSGDGS
jgi:hypothetical protein